MKALRNLSLTLLALAPLAACGADPEEVGTTRQRSGIGPLDAADIVTGACGVFDNFTDDNDTDTCSYSEIFGNFSEGLCGSLAIPACAVAGIAACEAVCSTTLITGPLSAAGCAYCIYEAYSCYSGAVDSLADGVGDLLECTCIGGGAPWEKPDGIDYGALPPYCKYKCDDAKAAAWCNQSKGCGGGACNAQGGVQCEFTSEECGNPPRWHWGGNCSVGCARTFDGSGDFGSEEDCNAHRAQACPAPCTLPEIRMPDGTCRRHPDCVDDDAPVCIDVACRPGGLYGGCGGDAACVSIAYAQACGL